MPENKVQLYTYTFRAVPPHGNVLDTLNDMGAQGWLCIHMYQARTEPGRKKDTPMIWGLYFARPKQGG